MTMVCPIEKVELYSSVCPVARCPFKHTVTGHCKYLAVAGSGSIRESYAAVGRPAPSKAEVEQVVTQLKESLK